MYIFVSVNCTCTRKSSCKDWALFIYLLLQGIKLHQTNDGSIVATRLGYTDVIVQGHRDPLNHCLSEGVVVQRGRLEYNRPMKVRTPVTQNPASVYLPLCNTVHGDLFCDTHFTNHIPCPLQSPYPMNWVTSQP